MRKSLSDMCSDIARHAVAKNHEFLGHLLRIAALEASTTAAHETFVFPAIHPRDLVVGLWDWDVPNNVRHLDDTGASLFGYSSKARFIEQQLTERIHPDDVAEWRRKVSQTAALGGTYFHEYRIIRNGNPIWVRAKSYCTLDRSGRPERFPGAMIDITQLKSAG